MTAGSSQTGANIASGDIDFGPDFVWGVSTSNYQIEGATHEDGRGDGIWDTACRRIGGIDNGDTADVACDHYHRYSEDIALMRELGIPAYRFSVSWPRLLPAGRGEVNARGLAFYDRLIDALLSADIEPWLCLYHWDLPQALDDLGGWRSRDSAGWFGDFAALVAQRYGDRVRRFATFNEPSVFAQFGHEPGWDRAGFFEPFLRAIHHVNLAHGAAVDALRALARTASVGAIHNWQPCRPATDSAEDRRAAELFDACWNQMFPAAQLLAHYPAPFARALEPFQQAGDLARICRPLDWFGLNHYSPIYARVDPDCVLGFAFADAPAELVRSGMGAVVLPEAFRDALLDAHRRYRLPIYVLENGFSSPDQPDKNGQISDHQRIDYLRRYTRAMGEAMAAGADVRGYFVWTLLDNFEWGAGYSQRFGLVYVDYKTLRRIPKSSARWYAQLIRTSTTVRG